MSKCLKCGAPLPAFGECSECHAPSTSVAPKVPPLLDRELEGRELEGREILGRPTVEVPLPAPQSPPAIPKGRILGNGGPGAPTMPSATLPGLPSVPSRAAPPIANAPTPKAAPIPPPMVRPRFEAPQPREDSDDEAKTRLISIAGWPALADAAPTPHPAEMEPEADEPSVDPDPEPTQILALPKRPVAKPAATPPSGSEAAARATPPARAPHVPKEGEVYASIAPIWRRLVAGAVDFGAISAVAGLYLAIALAVTGRKAPHTTLTGLDGLMITLHGWQPLVTSGGVLTALLAAAYSVAFNVMWDGRTPGRKLMGLKLVDMSGSAPAPALAMKRALLCWLSALAFLSGYWLMLFDRRRQSLHDKLTQTLIVLPGFPTP